MKYSMKCWGAMNKKYTASAAIYDLLESIKANKKINVNDLYFDILSAYKESHRYYHTLSHIADCFEEFEEVKHLFKNPLISKYVLMNHDIVYIPCFKYNEAASAVKTQLMSYNLGLSEGDVHLATVGIHATNHSSFDLKSLDDKFSDEKLIADIDMCILGANRTKFMDYEIGIRKEFGFCSDAHYIEGRVAFLSTLLAEPKIFLTAYFYDKHEKKARENVKHLLEILTVGK